MTEAKIIIGFGVVLTILAFVMNSDFHADPTPVVRSHDAPAIVTEPAFTGEQSRESRYAELQAQWRKVREKDRGQARKADH
ncbi:MAG: hypothetical protein LBK01_01310 [Burkholderiaceae bacterium]|jgi:hypothetical protein|nr:hypothetical protein [Burkholderiaceae bacterium]